MDFSKPINAQCRMNTSKEKRSWKKRLLWWVVGLLTFIALLVLCAPLLLSTTMGRRIVLEKINETIAPAQLTVEDWSLAWFDEQHASAITYTDKTNGVRVDIAQLRVSSLWALLPFGQIRAHMTVESPSFSLDNAMQTDAPLPLAKKETTGEGSPVSLPDWNISLQMVIVDAAVHLSTLDEPLLQRGHLEVAMPATDQEIVARLSTALLDGKLSASATLSPPQALLTAKAPAEALRSAKLALTAPWAEFTMSATSLPELPYPEIKAQSSIPLPELMARLRTLGLIADEVAMHSGSLDFHLTLLRGLTPKTMRFETGFTSSTIRCSYAEKPIELFANLTAAAVIDPDNLPATELARVEIQLPGIEAGGSGTLKQGSLSAKIQTQTLLNNLKPFTRGFELAAPVDLTLTAKTSPGNLLIDATADVDAQRSLTLNLSAPGFDAEARNIGQLHLAGEVELAPLRPFISDDVETFEGKAFLHAAAVGTFDNLRSNLVFAVQNFNWQTEGWKLREPSLINSTASLNWTAEAWSLKKLQLSSPLGSLSGDLSLQSGTNLTEGLSAEVAGSLSPGYPLEHWKVWGRKATPTKVDGTVHFNLKARPNADGHALPLLDIAADAERLHVALPKQPILDTPVNLACTLKDAPDGTLVLDPLTLKTPYLLLTETSGSYTSEGNIELKGILTADLDKLWVLLTPEDYQAAGFAVSGVSTQPFSFSAPLLYGPEGIINYGQGTAAIATDRITVPGLDIPEAIAALDFNKGVATLELTAPLNGGNVYLHPSINLTTHPYVLTLPHNAHVLSDIRVTQAMLDEGLGVVSPVLMGATWPSGTIDVVISDFRMVLDDNPLANLETSAQIRTKSLTLRANDLVTSLLILLKKDYQTTLDDQDFNVTVANGILTSDPLDMRIDNVRLTCQGQTHLLTKALDYELLIPLTQDLLGQSTSKYLKKGETLHLPIQGVLGKPRIDLDPLRKLTLELAQWNARKKAVEALEGRKQSSSNKRTQAALGIVQGFLQDNDSDESVSDAVLNSLFQLL